MGACYSTTVSPLLPFGGPPGAGTPQQRKAIMMTVFGRLLDDLGIKRSEASELWDRFNKCDADGTG